MVQCRHLIPALNECAARVKYMTARLYATQFLGHGCMHDLTTECSFDAQATWVIDVLSLSIDMPSMVVCTTRHWETSGRLVQEINVCTVVAITLLVRPLFSVLGKKTR